MTEQMQRAINFRRGLTAMLGASTIEAPAALLCMEARDWWQPGKLYPSGTVLRYAFEAWGEQLVETIREVDTVTHPDWTPEAAPSEYKAYHGTSRETARPYLMRNSEDRYMAGEWCLWVDKPYRCVVDNTVHDPDTLPGSWEVGV